MRIYVVLCRVVHRRAIRRTSSTDAAAETRITRSAARLSAALIYTGRLVCQPTPPRASLSNSNLSSTFTIISTTNCWNIMTESKVYYRDYSSTITITFVILIIALISAFSPACAETFTSRCATTRCGVPTLADTRTYQRRWIITRAPQCIAMQPLSNSSNLWPCLAPLPLKFHDDTSNGSRVTVLTNKQTNKHTQTHTHKRTVLKTIPFVALLSASPVDFIMFFFYCIDILCVCSVILCVWCWQILWFCA